MWSFDEFYNFFKATNSELTPNEAFSNAFSYEWFVDYIWHLPSWALDAGSPPEGDPIGADAGP